MLISIHDKTLSKVAFLDNEKPNTLHYFDDTWHRYLTEATSTFDFSVPKRGQEDLSFLTEKGYVSFSYGGNSYLFSIMKIEETEKKMTCYCENLNLELLNETSPEYKAPGARSFVQYMSLLGMQYAQLEMGTNEVSDLSRTLEWTGTETKLARLLSLVNKFDAECEFVTYLNRDGTLDKIVLNVYRKHDDNYQGVGTRREDTTLYYGKQVKEIRRTVDKTGLYTAIKPIGTDGLAISTLDKTEYDTDGKVLFRSAAGDTHILCPPMREEYPSQVVDPTGDRYINLDWTYETKNVNTLYGQALAKLKAVYMPAITYEVDGFFNLDIGDTVKIHDDGFTPLLLLEARVSEQEISFSKPDTNKTTFANFRALENRLSSGIQIRLEALIQQSVPYTADIITTEGIVFKNGEGSTKLTARVSRGTNIVTSQLKIQWYKDGAALSTNEAITVNAADVTGKAVYRFEATDSAGDIKCFSEVTVVDVSDGEDGEDGKAQYLHVKYSNDGGQTFTANQGETPGKWMGYYVDFESADSNNPDNYTWVKVEGPTGADGKDGKDGTNGTPATAYSMLVSAYAVVRSENGAYTPSTITLTGQAQTGENPLVSYAGRFRIQETTDMETWLTKYTSSANEAEKTFMPSAGIKAISCSMYLAGGTTTLLDRQIIPIVSDGKDGEDGTDGNDGAAGKGISSTAITYQASSSGTTVPTGTWTTTIPTVAANQYLWTRTIITYTDNSTSTAYSIGKVGANGSKGDKGDTGDIGITGPKGADGKSSYTHIAYANSADGKTDFTVSDSNRKYIGMYVDFTQADSTDPTKYSWSLIKGADGSNGTPGKAGADGKTPYFHVAYANSADGKTGFSATDSTDKLYIGQYTDYTQVDSTDPTKYSWTKIKGEDGNSSYTHIRYALDSTGLGMTDKPDNIIYGETTQKGEGTPSLTNVRELSGISSSALPQTLYSLPNGVKDEYNIASGKGVQRIGRVVLGDTDAPIIREDTGTYGKYRFRTVQKFLSAKATAEADKQIVSDKVASGISGATWKTEVCVTVSGNDNGAIYCYLEETSEMTLSDAKIWFSDNPITVLYELATPIEFTGAIGVMPYIGIATTDSAVAPTDASAYTWSKYVGKDGKYGTDGKDGTPGKDGAPGKPGTDGKSSYTHIAYANSADGKTDFSVDNSNRKYIGMYVDFTQADSTDPTKYSWSLIKGADGSNGTPGKAGADGKTPYFHVAYANSADGKTGFSATDSTDKLYIGQYTDYTQVDSTDPTKYAWTRIKGDKGAAGEDGIGVKSTTVAYQASTSGTTVPTGAWTSSIPSVAANQYLWTRTVITYTDDTTSISYSIGKMGANGTDGADAYTIVLSNESHTFVGGTSAALAGSTICKVLAYKGGTQIAATIGTISGLPAGMTATIANNSTVNAQFTITVTTAMATTSGMLTIPITVDGKSFTKFFSFALALKGSTGAAGATGPQGDPMGILELATEPPTKYSGMLWKHTGTVSGLIKNAVYRWNGSAWVLFKFKAENIEATSLSAISADLGTVNAGTINGVDINGGRITGNVNFELRKTVTSGSNISGSTRVIIDERGVYLSSFDSGGTHLISDLTIGTNDIKSTNYWKIGIFEKVKEMEDNLPYTLFSGARDIKDTTSVWNPTFSFGDFAMISIRIVFQSLRTTIMIRVPDDGVWCSFSFGHNSLDGSVRTIYVRMRFSGRYIIQDISTKISLNGGAATELGTGYIFVDQIVGYRY